MAAASHSSLLQHCVAVLDSFNPNAVGVEQHLKNYFEENNSLAESDSTFISEVFSGCVRHSKILAVVINGYYNQAGKTSLKADSNLYTVLYYLALFRLDELGMVNIRKFVRSQDVNKMFKFLTFSLNEENLTTWMKDEWSQIYEHSYVQVQLLSPILRWLPELKELISQLEAKIANTDHKTKRIKTPTEIKPFNLTQPRPKSIPIPEEIPAMTKAKAVPKAIYRKPKEEDLLEEAKKRNRRKAEEQLLDASKNQFGCATAEKSEKTKTRRSKILSDEESKLQFDKPKARKAPAVITDNIPIKLNAATILREGALYQKREEDQMKKLEQLEAGAKDTTDFLEWQQSMRQRDTEAELAEIERRRIEGKLSHEEAILARQTLIKENKLKVQEMKAEADELLQDYVKRRLQEEQVLKKVVDDIIAGHKNAKQARVRIQEYKKKLVEEVNEESKELMRRAFEEAAAEMRRKVELIQQIRAMEALPKDKPKLIDWTATAGHSLLSEMSISELKERLSLLKISEEERLDQKRDSILENKEAKDQMLMSKLQQISRHRAAEGQASAARNAERQKSIKQRVAVKSDPKLQDLQAKLEQRRRERLEASREMKVSPTKQSAARTNNLVKQKKTIEENRWKELEKRKEKQATLLSQGIVTNVAGQTLSSFGRARKMSAGPVLS